MSNAHANTSPHLVAQIAKGTLLVADQFETWGLTDPHQRAEHLIRRLRTELDWGPPRTPADEPIPPLRPARAADPDHVARVLADARAQLDAKKRARTTPG